MGAIPKNGHRDSDQSVERLRKAGLRVTAPRLAILRALEADRTHPTAEKLLLSLRREQPSLSLSTVYNTLESFIRAGLCERVNSDGIFRVDGALGADHDHAFCRRCGQVFDVDRRQLPPVEFPSRLPRGLMVRRVRIEYEVVCAECRGALGA